MKIAIALLTRDKIELIRRSLGMLLDGARAKKFDLFIIDGSTKETSEIAIWEMIAPTKLIGTRPDNSNIKVVNNIRGGADTAVCYALNYMLDHPNRYTHVGLVESDVVLDHDWFDPVVRIFDTARADGLIAGNVSARSYEDRVLFQRDGYAVMHNLGFGTQILTRGAAEIFVRNIRSWFTLENRRVFMQLAGVDIGRFWAFSTGEHWLVPDWGLERVLAQHGYASLALTPAKCQMIGQDPPLAQQGLKLTTEPVRARRWPDRFVHYRDNLRRVREGDLVLTAPLARACQNGTYTIFTHHLFGVGAEFTSGWGLKWTAGFGPFAWEAREKEVDVVIPVYGSVNFIVGGTGQIEVEDLASGYKVTPTLNPTGPHPVMQVLVPGNVTQRKVRLLAREPGPILYGISTSEPQLCLSNIHFHHSRLPCTS